MITNNLIANRESLKPLFKAVGLDGVEWLFGAASSGGWVITRDGEKVAAGSGSRGSVEAGAMKFQLMASKDLQVIAKKMIDLPVDLRERVRVTKHVDRYAGLAVGFSELVAGDDMQQMKMKTNRLNSARTKGESAMSVSFPQLHRS